MGDASLPPTQAVLTTDGIEETQYIATDSVREIHVLVTGFGPFKSFGTNPSYLIASHLSRQLDPESQSASVALKNLNSNSQHPIRDPDPRPYKINVHVFPTPVRVAYDTVRELIPKVISDVPTEASPPEFMRPANGYDYVMHIGLAAGREKYTAETIAHRDYYKIKDVDDLDGSKGEAQWKAQGVPESLDVGWSKEDVLARWEVLTRQREDEYEREELEKAGWKEDSGMTLVETARFRSMVFLGKGKRAIVKLSKDAGRYLCEFIFNTSLAVRWREARDAESKGSTENHNQTTDPREKIGKVAFLHVPGGTMKHDIARGVRVAESLIIALVGSWEDGYRNPDVYGNGKLEHTDSNNSGMYDLRGTGDR